MLGLPVPLLELRKGGLGGDELLLEAAGELPLPVPRRLRPRQLRVLPLTRLLPLQSHFRSLLDGLRWECDAGW